MTGTKDKNKHKSHNKAIRTGTRARFRPRTEILKMHGVKMRNSNDIFRKLKATNHLFPTYRVHPSINDS